MTSEKAKKTFVGFGFGPIQSGLMVFEAQRSGNFGRFVIAEIEQALVEAVRANGNRVSVNVAHESGIFAETLNGIELLNPSLPEDRALLAKAIGEADEMATALPSVKLYGAGGPGAVAQLLAEHINPDRPQILYASENNNYAAEILEKELRARAPENRFAQFQALNTVVGKMSGVVRDEQLIREMGLATMTPGLARAVLVEEFNRIKITRVHVPGYEKGIGVFEEKDDLLPFEEAKLFGHNAIHALLGYLAWSKGLKAMSDIRAERELLETGRRAFMDECGAALIRKHGSSGDTLFTPEGWRAYAEDLLARMTNPFLRDAVDRICRDPGRKLAYGDRLIGTMRECLAQRVEPRILARGAAVAVEFLLADSGARMEVAPSKVKETLAELWKSEPDDGLKGRCADLVAREIG